MRSSCRILAALILVHFIYTPTIFSQMQKTKIDQKIEQAQAYLANKDYKSARKAFDAALKIYDKSVPAIMGYGQLELAEKKWGAAENKFNKVIKLEPEDLSARYFRAISLREAGLGKARFIQNIPGVNRLLEWKRAEKEFERIIAKDSLFKDVIYQYSVLESYREHFKKAIEMAHRQLRLHPEQISTSLGIFRHYRQLIKYHDNANTEKWLQEHSDWEEARFFIAEKWRRENKLQNAQSALLKLLQERRRMSPIPIYFNLALISRQLENSFQAQQFYWRGINAIQTLGDAEFHFQYIKYILSEHELQTYSKLKNPEELSSFYKRIWLKRDPTPAAQLNVRLLEHLRRYAIAVKDFEYLASRTQATNPDRLNRLKFPAPYDLNKEFNDKGFIFLRHGEPDDRVMTIAENSLPNESWRYFQRGQLPELTFHFLVTEAALPDNWRLTPMLEDNAMLRDRISWGTDYYRMLNAPKVEQLSIEEDLIAESKVSVSEGFTRDRHTWQEKVEPLSLEYSIATFRGENNQTAMEFFYNLPLAQIQKAAGENEKIVLDQGLVLHNMQWETVKKDNLYSDLVIPKNPVNPRIMIINSFRFSVKPEKFHLAMHAKPENTPLLGGFRFDYNAQDYSGEDLLISDIELAYDIKPAHDPKFTHKGLDIMVNPSSKFSHLKPFHSYVEVYNLQKDNDGNTHYEITHKLKLSKSKKSAFQKLFSLFGVGKKSSISLTNRREGKDAEAIEYLALDTRAIELGQYNLTIKIRDLNSGQTVSKTKALLLY